MDNAELERRLPIQRRWMYRLVEVSAKCFTPTPGFDAEDHWAFMALSYAFKQNEHARSVLTLGDSVDATLIVRSMLEGLTQLLWAANDTAQRPLLWRAFAYIHDWRLLMAAERRGESLPPDHRESILDGVREYGHLFVTRKAKEKLDRGEEVQDPYRVTWSGKTARQLFEDEQLHASVHYENIYRPFSDWHHWSTPGLANAMTVTGEGYTFSTRSARQTALCLSAAFLCLWQTMDVTDKAAGLGRAQALAEVRDGYIRELGSPSDAEVT